MFCRSCSSDLTLGLPPEGRDGNRCLFGGGAAGRAGCTGSSGRLKGGVSMSAGRFTAKEKSLGGGVDEKDGLKVAASCGLKRAEDCVPEKGLAVVVLNWFRGVLGSSTGIWKKGFLAGGLTGRRLGILPPLPRFLW